MVNTYLLHATLREAAKGGPGSHERQVVSSAYFVLSNKPVQDNKFHTLRTTSPPPPPFTVILILPQVAKCSVASLHSMTSQLGRTQSPTPCPSSSSTLSRMLKIPLNHHPCTTWSPLTLSVSLLGSRSDPRPPLQEVIE